MIPGIYFFGGTGEELYVPLVEGRYILMVALLLGSDNVLYVALGVVARDGEGQVAWVHGGGAYVRGHPPAGRQGGR